MAFVVREILSAFCSVPLVSIFVHCVCKGSKRVYEALRTTKEGDGGAFPSMEARVGGRSHQGQTSASNCRKRRKEAHGAAGLALGVGT